MSDLVAERQSLSRKDSNHYRAFSRTLATSLGCDSSISRSTVWNPAESWGEWEWMSVLYPLTSMTLMLFLAHVLAWNQIVPDPGYLVKLDELIGNLWLVSLRTYSGMEGLILGRAWIDLLHPGCISSVLVALGWRQKGRFLSWMRHWLFLSGKTQSLVTLFYQFTGLKSRLFQHMQYLL